LIKERRRGGDITKKYIFRIKMIKKIKKFSKNFGNLKNSCIFATGILQKLKR
jgi:hypothetical protein